MRFLALTALCLMTACGGGGVSLETRPVSPDEFMVTTQAPLAAPKGGAELPAPDLGGPNLADLRPDAQFIAALGGRGTGPQSASLAAPLSQSAADVAIDPAAEAARLEALGIKVQRAQ